MEGKDQYMINTLMYRAYTIGSTSQKHQLGQSTNERSVLCCRVEVSECLESADSCEPSSQGLEPCGC